MPKHGPRLGSLKQIIAFLPIWFKPSTRPTLVVVLPSPAGVGEMAVTKINLPFLWSFNCSGMIERFTLALYLPYCSKYLSAIPNLAAIASIGLISASLAMSISVFTKKYYPPYLLDDLLNNI